MRIDGKFHLSDGLQVRKLIKNAPYKVRSIFDVTSNIYCPGIFQRHYTSSGTPFLGGADIQKQSYDSGKYLKESTTPNHEILAIKKGWTLVTCGGTVGETAFANRELAKCWLSQHVMRLIPDGIKPGMLYSYLATNEGKMLLTTNTYGSVIPTLNSNSIGELPIPEFPESFQQEVDDLIQESARLREETTRLLETAKKLLSDYINNDFASTSGCVTATRNIQDIRNSLQCRLDPPALINNSVLAFEQIKERCVKLGACNVSIWYPGMFKRAYVKNGLPYMQGSSVFEVNPFVRCAHLAKSRTPKLDELWLKEDLILITCAGSCGQVKLITKEYEDKNAIGSPDIIRIKSKDNLYTSGYLFTYLQIPIVQDYMQSFKYGSVIERFDALRTESIPVVKPTQELSDEITALIKQYKECTYHAFCAEEEAISMVEAEIESWTTSKKN